MKFYSHNYLPIFSFFLIPLLFLWNPAFFSFMGSQPYWPIFWLLPWAVINGPLETILVGLLLGLFLDAINNDNITEIPGLVICGFWFGRVGIVNKFDFTPLKYGLTASIGSLICGVIYFCQILLGLIFKNNYLWLFQFGIKNIFSQVLLTGLLAPIFCSWLYLLFTLKDRSKL